MTMNKDPKDFEKKVEADETVEDAVETEQANTESECEEQQDSADAASEEAAKPDEDEQKYLRLMADFQNYKRRVEKEKSDIYSFANEKIILQLLQVMDNFERALEHGDDDAFKEGMKLIFDQLKNLLEKEGVEEIPTENADFDPNFHSAVMMEETDEFESGKISFVLQKGYTLKGKVIRPSMVKVAQ